MQQPRSLFHPIPQHIDQCAACAVLHMQHAPMAVGCLQGGRECVAIPVKGHPQPLKPVHTVRCLLHQQANSIAITQSGPGAQRVFGMALSRVLLPGYRCDAPLRPTAGGATAGVSVQQQNRESRRQVQAGH